MNSPLINWLHRKRRLEGPACLLGAIGSAVAGLLVSAATAVFVFVGFVIGWAGGAAGWEIVTGRSVSRFPKIEIACFTGAFLALLFVRMARSKWWERGDIPAGVWSIYSSRENPASASATAVGMARIVTDILSWGPRIVSSSWRTFGKSLRWRRLNIESCAQVLEILAQSDRAVPRQELAGQLSSAVHWPDVEQQLRDIEGVLFLERGLTLNQELRLELNQLTHAPA